MSKICREFAIIIDQRTLFCKERIEKLSFSLKVNHRRGISVENRWNKLLNNSIDNRELEATC